MGYKLWAVSKVARSAQTCYSFNGFLSFHCLVITIAFLLLPLFVLSKGVIRFAFKSAIFALLPQILRNQSLDSVYKEFRKITPDDVLKFSVNTVSKGGMYG